MSSYILTLNSGKDLELEDKRFLRQITNKIMTRLTIKQQNKRWIILPLIGIYDFSFSISL